jgi:hypothetical protein
MSEIKTPRDKFAREMAALNYGLKLREREIQARALTSTKGQQPSKPRNTTTFNTFTNALDFVNMEITNSLKKISWKRLSTQYKTQFICDYIDKCERLDDRQKGTLKQLVTKANGELDDASIEYDMSKTRIVRLNYAFEGITI